MQPRVGIVGAHAHLLELTLRQYPYELIDPDTPPEEFSRFDISHLVSFGYRQLVPESVLASFGGRVFNIHISLLPWNRGSDPNFWSWFDGTPKGVSFHKMGPRLDSGPLIGQMEVEFQTGETMATSHQKLLRAGAVLFGVHLDSLMRMELEYKVVAGVGSYHSSRDIRKFEHILDSGWDTPCATVEEWGFKLGRRKGV